LDRGKFSHHLGSGCGLVFRRLLQRKFTQHIEVGSAGFQRLHGLDFSAKGRHLGDITLGAFAVVPEIRSRHTGLDFREFLDQGRQDQKKPPQRGQPAFDRRGVQILKFFVH
jgi:hypothetical protein